MTERKFGWVRDYPDIRDIPVATSPNQLESLTKRGKEVNQLLDKLGVNTNINSKPVITLPATVDLKSFCSPIEDQGDLGSCTAHAAMGLLEYFERRSFGKHVDGSRLFLYKTTRNLMKVEGDTGAYMRSVMGALTLFGVPPESFYPYDISKFDDEPSPFLYSFAQNYQALSYYRLDTPGTSNTALLTKIKQNLSKNLPSMFGFSVYNSYTQTETNGGCFPMPKNNEYFVGGHAVCVVGYSDTKTITNSSPGGATTTGALLIRNSWGTGWGQSGYGWIPYQYIISGLTSDWWSLVSSEWVDSGQFA